jgi:hypothetical protein
MIINHDNDNDNDNPPTSALAVSTRRVRLNPPDPPLLGPDFKKIEGGGCSQFDFA